MCKQSLICLIGTVLLAAASAGRTMTPVSTGSPAAQAPPAHTGAWGIELADRDPAIRAGDDFYMSQNGTWFAKTPVDDTRPNAAYWRDLRGQARVRVAELLASAAAQPQIGLETPVGKAAAFYQAYMDVDAIEAKGLGPLRADLDAIRATTTRARLARLLGAVAGPGTNRPVDFFARPLGYSLFGIDIAQDVNQPDRYAVYLHQAGLLLPGPEYYLDAQFADVRSAYRGYVAALLALAGWPQPDASAEAIIDFETRIARVSWSHEQMNDAVRSNNPMRVAELARLAPGFDWRAFLAGAGVAQADKVNIDARDAFPKMAAIFAATPTSVLQARQAFALVDMHADALGAAAVQRNFEFRTGLLAGQAGAGLPPRASRAALAVATHVDEIVASLYVAEHFTHEAKARALEMTGNLRTAFDRRIAALSWMTADTREHARRKLARMDLHIGYPDRAPDYRGLQISADDLYGDLKRSAAFKWRRAVSRLGTHFDRGEWAVTPSYPNYNYKPTTNTLELPAALLQPPFFDVHADAAVNYGAIGALIGEMMMAAFDPQGRHYDEDGRLREWWNVSDATYFDEQAHKLSAQYSAVEPLPGMHIKGDLVLGESLDDLGGLQIALDAYHIDLGGEPAPVLDGFSGDQRFFLGRAQMWRAKFGPTFVRNQIAGGTNAPPFLRVNGPLRNIDAWYAAFDVRPGDKLYLAPEERVRIW
jgi:putative endopeptidase